MIRLDTVGEPLQQWLGSVVESAPGMAAYEASLEAVIARQRSGEGAGGIQGYESRSRSQKCWWASILMTPSSQRRPRCGDVDW